MGWARCIGSFIVLTILRSPASLFPHWMLGFFSFEVKSEAPPDNGAPENEEEKFPRDKKKNKNRKTKRKINLR